MAYSDEAVKAKLSALNETQDSIVTVAQWIMFHRRHANKTASLWLSRLTDSSTAKRLNLIYLANEVVQQSRARGKPDFQLAFEPLISDATALAYKSASQEVQGKIKRVVEVWRQRSIFDLRIQEAAERRLDELDKQKGSKSNGSGGPRLGGSLFGGGGGSVPSELEGVSRNQASLSKAEASVKPALDHANTEFAKLTDPNTPLPTPPVHAARLSALMKNLAAAQGAVENSIKARTDLLSALDKLVETHRAKLAEDETTATDLATRKDGVEAKKKEVEDGIMRGLSAPSSPDIPTPTRSGSPNGMVGAQANSSKEVEAPEAEGFTPPPPDVEAFTPPPAPTQDTEVDTIEGPGDPMREDDPALEHTFTTTTGAESIQEFAPELNEPPPAFEPPPALQSHDSSAAAAAAANDFLNNLNMGMVRQASSEAPASTNGGDPRLKRRKLSHEASDVGEEDGLDFDVDLGGVDEDGVSAALLGR